LPSSGLRSATNVVGALPQRQTKESPAEPIPPILKIGVYNPLSMKRFPVVWVGNVHACALKPSIGRVSLLEMCNFEIIDMRTVFFSYKRENDNLEIRAICKKV
jgi:hypothetical protein